nr:hypothetical protein Itr_chr12CG30490 [Ipomoea trifida]
MTSGVRPSRSSCAICPIFSSKLIRPIKSRILAEIGLVGSLYFMYPAGRRAAVAHEHSSSNRSPNNGGRRDL